MPNSQPTTLPTCWWCPECGFISRNAQHGLGDGWMLACLHSDPVKATVVPDGFVGRGVEETLEAARLIFGTENVRVGTLLHERSDMWHARPAFSDEGSPCVVVSVLVRRATPNPPTETPNA